MAKDYSLSRDYSLMWRALRRRMKDAVLYAQADLVNPPAEIMGTVDQAGAYYLRQVERGLANNVLLSIIESVETEASAGTLRDSETEGKDDEGEDGN